jgi:hypothetical protein
VTGGGFLDAGGRMKKLFSVVAMLAIVAAVVSGCKKEEPAPAVPTAPEVSTNAPAAH